ncbi:unnamed protein product [Closterium sp. NIES-53]
MEELELVVLELEAMAREAIELEELELFTLELEVRVLVVLGVDYFHTFSPTPKMTTLRVLLHVAAQRDYELHSLDFSTAFLQGSLHEEIWLSRPPGFTGSFPTGTQWSLRRPVYGLRHAPQEWHDPTRTTLAALGLTPSTANPSLFLRTDTLLPPFYVLAYVDDLVFATADTEALTLVKSFSASASSSPRHSPLLCLPATRSKLHLWTSSTSGMGLVLGGRGLVVLTGHADASWLTYLLTDLGEQPRSPPALYVDNKAMISLCQEHRLEHRTKHIALRYFLARELQQRGQLRLAYVATRANTADVFTKALPPGDHQRFVTVLGLLALLFLTGLWQTSMDAEMASWKSTSTYVDEVPPPRANIVDGMWIFRVKRPPGSPPAFKARYFARGFSQRQGVHFFQTFSPTPKMTTLWVLLHVAAQRDYELYSLDFSTAFLQGSLHKEIWLCRPPGFTVSFPAGTKWSLWWPVYILHQPPREWHDTLRTTLAALGFAPSSAYPSLFLRTDTTLPQFYVLVYVDDLVFAIADTEALALVKAELHRDTPALTWVLRRFEFQYSSPQPTPLSTGHSLSAPPSDECSSYSC